MLLTYRLTQLTVRQNLRGWGNKIPLRPSVERDECTDIVAVTRMTTQVLVSDVRAW